MEVLELNIDEGSQISAALRNGFCISSGHKLVDLGLMEVSETTDCGREILTLTAEGFSVAMTLHMQRIGSLPQA